MEIKYGDQILNLKIDKPFDTFKIDLNKTPLTKEEIFTIFENEAIYSESLTTVIENAKRILFIVPDITRKSGLTTFFSDLISIVESKNKPFSIIFATGTHRKVNEDEKKWILGEDVYVKYKDVLLDHDPDDPATLEYFGKTKNGTPILLNKAYLEHDTIIPIASISYHYFAGFGGGRKMILPGIASRKSALNNHKLALSFREMKRHPLACTGNLKQNPVNDDIVEAVMIARRGKTFFAINTILNDNGEIIDVTCGDLFVSHIQGTELLKKYTSVKVDKKYDLLIVSTGGYPKDINMIQAQKSLDRAVAIAEDNATIIFFAECRDGYGNKHFEEFFDLPNSAEMMKKLATDYQINRQTAYSVKYKTEKFKVFLYSNFDDADAKRMGFIPLKDITEVNKMVQDAKNIAFIPDAYNIFFTN